MEQNTYGYDPSDWKEAKAEAVVILSGLAREPGKTISYSELAAKIQAIHFDPSLPPMGGFLGQISMAEESANRGMLSVLVVHKTGDLRPGRGFYNLAQRLGRDVSDEDKLWVEELKKVHASWALTT